MDDRTNVILSPHFDDAVLSLGGLIAKAPERAVVVTVFAGIPPGDVAGRWDRRSGFASAASAIGARSTENRTALTRLGMAAAAICDLGFLDRQYRADKTASAALRSEIAAAVAEVVRRRGGRVNLLAPVSAWHPDHQAVGDAVTDIAAARMCPEADFFFYEDQPYAYLELRKRGLVPLRFADFAPLHRVAERRIPGKFDRQYVASSDAHIAKKVQAIHAYASQFAVVRPLLCKMLRDFSHYRARAAGVPAAHVEMIYRLAGGAPGSP